MTFHQVRHRVHVTACIGAALAAAALAQPARALPLLFTFSGSRNGGFQIGSNPMPGFIDATSFSAAVTGATGDFSGAGGVEFYLPSGGGGLASYVGPGNSNLVGLAGPQLFTGTLASPVFAPGFFKLEDPSTHAATSLTISGPGAPAPELASGWLAATLGILALAIARLPVRRVFSWNRFPRS